jgi:serine/threonine-protein kinase
LTPDQAQQALAGKQLTLAPASPSTTAGPCDGGKTVEAGQICKLLQGNQTVGTTATAGSTLRYQIFKPGRIPVPNVVSLKANDAEDQLVAAHLGYEEKQVNSAAAAGTVTKQDPPPYTPVAAGSKVRLYVSTGNVKLKDVVGEPAEKAVAELNRLQFTNVDSSATQRTTVRSKDGTVASESPTPGTAYSPDTKITLVIYRYVAPPPPSTSASQPSGSPSDSTSSSPSSSPSGSASSSPSGSPSSGNQGIAPSRGTNG